MDRTNSSAADVICLQQTSVSDAQRDKAPLVLIPTVSQYEAAVLPRYIPHSHVNVCQNQQ